MASGSKATGQDYPTAAPPQQQAAPSNTQAAQRGGGFTKGKGVAIEEYKARDNYTGTWQTDLLRAPCAEPGCCALAFFCPCCVSMALRKRFLHGDMTKYLCCGGFCPCSGHCCESKCPTCCLCLEAFICFAQSVASTRFLIQDEFNLKNTKCDNCIIATMIFLQYLACIFDIIACLTNNDGIKLAADILDLIADLVWCTVCACMQAQHKYQLDERDGLHRVTAPPQQAEPMQR